MTYRVIRKLPSREEEMGRYDDVQVVDGSLVCSVEIRAYDGDNNWKLVSTQVKDIWGPDLWSYVRWSQ